MTNRKVNNAVQALSYHMLEYQSMTQAQYQAVTWAAIAALTVMQNLVSEEMEAKRDD